MSVEALDRVAIDMLIKRLEQFSTMKVGEQVEVAGIEEFFVSIKAADTIKWACGYMFEAENNTGATVTIRRVA